MRLGRRFARIRAARRRLDPLSQRRQLAVPRHQLRARLLSLRRALFLEATEVERTSQGARG